MVQRIGVNRDDDHHTRNIEKVPNSLQHTHRVSGLASVHLIYEDDQPAPTVSSNVGFKDGGADVRDFRRAVLADRVAPVESLLLTAALAEARVATDPAGNSKLAKSSEGGRRQKARDDAAAAAVLAVAAGARQWHSRPPGRSRRHTVAG